jgi:hypothetical protein
MATIDLSKYDSEQAKLMKERCILVNENDESLGAIDKKDCESVSFECDHIAYSITRSFDGKHQRGHATPRFLCFPLQTIGWKTLASATGTWKNYLSKHVDEHLLFSSFAWFGGQQ